ncbi:MAG: DNA-binding response regulator [Rhizobacter sp.]|jgi:two-component system response regulator DctR|nr:DNA-binding response regulator [Rhizobacter sp.]
MDAAVHIVDDDTDTRDALAWLLDSRGHKTTGWPCGESFLGHIRALRGAWPVAVVLMDIRMEPLSGLATFKALKELGCPWLVIFLTGHADVSLAVSAVKSGAWDFMEKPFQNNTLVDRIETALMEAGSIIGDAAVRVQLQQAFEHLSQREREVLDELILGNFNKVIAEHLDITPRTVEFHRANIFLKMGVSSPVELAHKLGRYRIGR